MNCRRAQKLLARQTNEALPQEVSSHLEVCEKCKDFLALTDELRNLFQIRNLGSDNPAIVERIALRVSTELAKPEPVYAPIIYAWAFRVIAAAACAAAIVGLYVRNAPIKQLTGPTWLAESPAPIESENLSPEAALLLLRIAEQSFVSNPQVRRADFGSPTAMPVSFEY